MRLAPVYFEQFAVQQLRTQDLKLQKARTQELVDQLTQVWLVTPKTSHPSFLQCLSKFLWELSNVSRFLLVGGAQID